MIFLKKFYYAFSMAIIEMSMHALCDSSHDMLQTINCIDHGLAYWYALINGYRRSTA